MARPAKPRALKVYRTAIGFHDAYVAAPSMKAALAAWGTDKNLFARGAAELVVDPALTAAPLAKPGEVVRVLRGSAADHVQALGRQAARKPAKRQQRSEPSAEDKTPSAPPPPPPPRPSRSALDRAEQAGERVHARHEGERARIAARMAALAEEECKLRSRQREEAAAAEEVLAEAKAKFEAAMQAWREA